MMVANSLIAQDINPFAGLGELGSELNDLRSFVIVVILIFGVGMIYLMIDRSRQTTRRQELESRDKNNALQAQESSTVVTALREMFSEMAKSNREQAESQRLMAEAIDRNSTVGRQNSQVITANTEGYFAVNESIKTLPAAMSAIVEGAAQRNMAGYTSQMTGLGTDLENIRNGIKDINKALKDKHWLNSTDAAKIFATQERIDKALNTLILNTTGEFPTVTEIVIQSKDEKKEGD